MENRTPRFRDYLKMLSRGKKWIVSATFISMAAAYIVTLFLPDIYKATAVVAIRLPIVKTSISPGSLAIYQAKPSLDRLGPGSFGTDVEYLNISMRIWEEALGGQEILKKVIDKLKLDKMTVGRLAKMLKVKRLEEERSRFGSRYAPAIKLLARVKREPRLAADIVNTWSELFVQEFNAFYLSQLKEVYEFTLKELETAKKKLAKAEQDLKQFESTFKEAEKDFKIQAQETGLKRELDSAKASYELFRRKAEQAKISVAERAPRAIVVSKAVICQKSVAANMKLIVGLAGLSGLLLSLFFVIDLKGISKE